MPSLERENCQECELMTRTGHRLGSLPCRMLEGGWPAGGPGEGLIRHGQDGPPAAAVAAGHWLATVPQP
ncbi:MAG TPA: hypothetical protein DHU96_01020 [Actinobacteria bacterium]|nr:hypothetical protein [Actinomycetota bacterium]